MQQIRTETEIAATPREVWSILVDFGRYPEWNPLIPKIRGWPEPGAPLDFRVELGGRRFPVQARVLRADRERELRWRGPRSKLLGKLFAGEHYFALEPAPLGCRFIHGENFTGVTASLVWPRLEPLVRDGYSRMNSAIKARAETMHANSNGGARSRV
jgi:hypothetical protein